MTNPISVVYYLKRRRYEEYIQDGNDPRDHILYNAAVVLGKTENFQTDIAEYLKSE